MGHPPGCLGPEARFLVHAAASCVAGGPSSPSRPRCTQRLEPAAFSALPTPSTGPPTLSCAHVRPLQVVTSPPGVPAGGQAGAEWLSGRRAAGGLCLWQTRKGRKKSGHAFTDEPTDCKEPQGGREGQGCPPRAPRCWCCGRPVSVGLRTLKNRMKGQRILPGV